MMTPPGVASDPNHRAAEAHQGSTPDVARHPLDVPGMFDDGATDMRFGKPAQGWRRRLFTVIFESETRGGRLFDLILIAVILSSVAVVLLDSVAPIARRHGQVLRVFELIFTAAFTLEYLARLASVRRPLRYAISFYGVIDLLALLPTYLAVLEPALGALIDVRVLRLLRVFRIFKLSRYAQEYRALAEAMVASRRKITVFLGFVLLMVLVSGTLMYVVEGPAHGFTSIPVAMYWAISTMTTVGFGDLVPKTDVGRLIASVMMLSGWGVLAVPTGIVTSEMAAQRRLAAGPAQPTHRRLRRPATDGLRSRAVPAGRARSRPRR